LEPSGNTSSSHKRLLLPEPSQPSIATHIYSRAYQEALDENKNKQVQYRMNDANQCKVLARKMSKIQAFFKAKPFEVVFGGLDVQTPFQEYDRKPDKKLPQSSQKNPGEYGSLSYVLQLMEGMFGKAYAEFPDVDHVIMAVFNTLLEKLGQSGRLSLHQAQNIVYKPTTKSHWKFNCSMIEELFPEDPYILRSLGLASTNGIFLTVTPATSNTEAMRMALDEATAQATQDAYDQAKQDAEAAARAASNAQDGTLFHLLEKDDTDAASGMTAPNEEAPESLLLRQIEGEAEVESEPPTPLGSKRRRTHYTSQGQTREELKEELRRELAQEFEEKMAHEREQMRAAFAHQMDPELVQQKALELIRDLVKENDMLSCMVTEKFGAHCR